MKTWSSTKPEGCIALSLPEDRAAAKIEHVVFDIGEQTDKTDETYKHTDTQTRSLQYIAPYRGLRKKP